MLQRGPPQVIDFLYRAIWHMDCSPPEASGWGGGDGQVFGRKAGRRASDLGRCWPFRVTRRDSASPDNPPSIRVPIGRARRAGWCTWSNLRWF